MTDRAIQLVLQYDGSEFAGWQRQPGQRTVQGVLEEALTRLTGHSVAALGAGRTDAGVHARGQAAGLIMPVRWSSAELRRALNAIVPPDLWVGGSFDMQPSFHARFSATSRLYSYRVGTNDEARAPFRRRWEHAVLQPLQVSALTDAARAIVGEHCFVAFAVRGTAPATDNHRCRILSAEWRAVDGGLVFEIEGNRFLHHMVRFLVGTMLDVATGRRPGSDIDKLLTAGSNDDVSAPAPAHALCLERVAYPAQLYAQAA